MGGTEANIARTLTKRSPGLPLPGGEGGVRGKGLFDSPSRPLSFKSLFLFTENSEELSKEFREL
jgi:hypothetical protein